MRLIALELGPFFSNCYVVGAETDGEGLVIDAGAEPQDIMVAVKRLRLKIKYVVATHGHMDHVGAVREVKQATGAQFVIHQADVPFLSRRTFGGSGAAAMQPDVTLQGGEVLTAGNLSLTVVHTPGHSPGGICLVGNGVVFSGDTLFKQGIGRYDFPGSSGRQLLDSIQNKLLVLPDETAVYPGHGPDTTIGEERRHNPFLLGDEPL